MNWKETSSFSQGCEDRTPNEFRLRVCGRALQIVLHRHIHHAPDAWLVSCYPEIIPKQELQAKDIKSAQVEAERLVRCQLEQLTAAMRSENKGENE